MMNTNCLRLCSRVFNAACRWARKEAVKGEEEEEEAAIELSLPAALGSPPPPPGASRVLFSCSSIKADSLPRQSGRDGGKPDTESDKPKGAKRTAAGMARRLTV